METKNKISETRLKEIVKSVVSEISINKKKELTKNAFNAVKGVQDNIKTFCIVTGENPMGEPGSNKLNRTNKNSLTNYLRFGNFPWTTVRGKYGNSENPKMIFNITLSDAKIIALKFIQESFIFGRKMDDKVYFDLYFINENKTDYELKETQDYSIEIDGDDYFTVINNKYKFNIPFKYFNEACDSFNNVINEIKDTHPKYKNEFERFLNESLLESKTLKSRYTNRTLLYGGLF